MYVVYIDKKIIDTRLNPVSNEIEYLYGSDLFNTLITPYKKYKVIVNDLNTIGNDEYVIINDLNQKMYYHKDNFITLDEYRENKIDEILTNE